jgi:DNA-binding response OmpR family regulator
MIDSGAELRSNTMDTKTIGLIAEILDALRQIRSGVGAVPPALTVRYRAGDIEIDEVYRTVTVSGREVALRPKEYELLLALARRNGAPVSKEKLLEEVWDQRVETTSRTLDQHICELRRKLERGNATSKRIRTVRKFGYSLKP